MQLLLGIGIVFVPWLEGVFACLGKLFIRESLRNYRTDRDLYMFFAYSFFKCVADNKIIK